MNQSRLIPKAGMRCIVTFEGRDNLPELRDPHGVAVTRIETHLAHDGEDGLEDTRR
ncbi:MAG: hypothetical protein CM1200mP18_21910 [Gammaproteobacteria bacterium]|nr:MAG: hypothetical protein CM1200mP18_21910 [Gammaproteobacteria bacterium]